MSKINFSIVIPSINEDKNLIYIIPKIKKILKKNYEIIIIGSRLKRDNSDQICKNLKVKFFRRKNNDSYGNAVRLGIKKSKGKSIIFMDGDGSHDPFFLKEFIKKSDSYDLIIASRYIKNGNTENSYLLILLSLILNIFYSKVLGLKIKDISNSYKCYNAKLLKKINLKCNDFDIIEEILFKLFKINKFIKYIELPFTFKKRRFGRSKRNFAVILLYLITLIKLRLNL